MRGVDLSRFTFTTTIPQPAPRLRFHSTFCDTASGVHGRRLQQEGPLIEHDGNVLTSEGVPLPSTAV